MSAEYFKGSHVDRNIPNTALPNDLHTENQDDTTPLPPQETQVVADDAPITWRKKTIKYTKRSVIHGWQTPIRLTKSIDRSPLARKFHNTEENKAGKKFVECFEEILKQFAERRI